MFREEAFIQVKRRMVGDMDLNDVGWKKEMDGARDVNCDSSAIVLLVDKKGSLIGREFVLGKVRGTKLPLVGIDSQLDPPDPSTHFV